MGAANTILYMRLAYDWYDTNTRLIVMFEYYEIETLIRAKLIQVPNYYIFIELLNKANEITTCS